MNGTRVASVSAKSAAAINVGRIDFRLPTESPRETVARRRITWARPGDAVPHRVSGRRRADPLSPATRELEAERDREGREPDRVLQSSRCEEQQPGADEQCALRPRRGPQEIAADSGHHG